MGCPSNEKIAARSALFVNYVNLLCPLHPQMQLVDGRQQDEQ